MPFGIGEGLALAGGLGSYFGGASAAKAQKELLRQQKRFGEAQLGEYRQVLPAYNQLLQKYEQAAGLGGSGDTRDPYGMNQIDRLRLQQAQQQIDEHARQQQNRVGFALGQRGIASGSIAAALGRAQQQGQDQYAQFRRQQLIDAPLQQQQRLAQLQGALGFGLGTGAQGANILGQQAGVYGQQAQQGYGGLQAILQQYQYQQMLRRYMEQGSAGAGGSYSDAASFGLPASSSDPSGYPGYAYGNPVRW